MFLQRDPDRPALHESSRARTAARHVQSLHPGALGRLVARELLAYAEFGCRFPQDGLTESVISEVLTHRDRCRARPSQSVH